MRRRAATLRIARGLLMAAAGPVAAADGASPDELVVYAAGSLRAPLTELAAQFDRQSPGTHVRLVFGASGLLKDRLLAGESAAVFASADLAHPAALVAAGRAEAVQRFARNRLCVLARGEAGVTADNVLARLLDADVRVGTSTPGADPSGDYAWTMFRRMEARGGPFAGAYARLDRKALQLTGGPGSPPPPAGRSVYAALLQDDRADVFVTYCSNAQQARREAGDLQVVALPEDVDVVAEYGVTTLRDAGPVARAFVDALRGAAGQALLQRHGLAAGVP